MAAVNGPCHTPMFSGGTGSPLPTAEPQGQSLVGVSGLESGGQCRMEGMGSVLGGAYLDFVTPFIPPHIPRKTRRVVSCQAGCFSH